MKSPNHMSRKGWKPDMIVLHVAEGTFKGTVSWLCNPTSGVSSHFVTGRNGERDQLVDLNMASWCNGTSTKEGDKYDYRRSTNRLVRERKTNANYYTISIENEGYSYKDGYGALTEPQYQTLLKLIKELVKRYDIPVDREHIVGHYEIAPKEKPNCPGPKFQWDRLMADLKGETSNNNETATDNEGGFLYANYKGSSIVDALKSIKVDSSFSNRKKLATLNGISNYTGTPNQNTQLLSLLKQGKLKSSSSSNTNTSNRPNNSNTSYLKANYRGSSIVDALKSIKFDSSFASRSKLAAKNGIKSYVGLPEQNIRMLNLLRSGKLKKY